jgi:predicted DNA-binding antitoxin AbrB/MazE fold protein
MLKYMHSEDDMQKTIDVIYEDGVFKPVKKVRLPEHSKLRVTVSEKKRKDSSLVARKQSEALLSIAGMWSSGDRDISENTDRYFYGTSRK